MAPCVEALTDGRKNTSQLNVYKTRYFVGNNTEEFTINLLGRTQWRRQGIVGREKVVQRKRSVESVRTKLQT
jgi:hypothetical protein